MERLLSLLLVLFLPKCYSFSISGSVSNFRPVSKLHGQREWQDRVPKFVRVFRKIEGKVEDDPLFPMVECIAKTADLRKAISVKALRVTHMTEVTQFVMLIEGSNNRQISAIASSIKEDVAAQFNENPYGDDGTAASGWFVLDYGSIIAHVMTPAMSNFYKLEKKWLDGEAVDLSHVITAPAPQDTAAASRLFIPGDPTGLDDWGFSSSGEETWDGDRDGNSDDAGADGTGDVGTGRPRFSFGSSHGTSSGRTAGPHEVPAEDVAFWGEDLAEQLFLEDQDNQQRWSQAAAVASGESPARKRLFRRPGVNSKVAASSTPSAAPEEASAREGKSPLKSLLSLLSRGPSRKPINADGLRQ